jgi:hypothetical protein
MNVQFLSNEKGRVTAVQVPIKDWKELERKINTLEVVNSIKKGLKEAEQIRKGEIKAKTIWEVLDEL